MKDFEQILTDSLDQLAAGEASVEDCLNRNPEHAARLKPLLQAAHRLQRSGRGVQPSPAYRERTRARLAAHMRSNPRNNPALSPFWRLTISLSALALAFVTTGTVFAQQALPGDTLYDWKRASESVWRAVSVDPLGTDLAISQRRALELTRVLQDPDKSLRAVEDYQESLIRLQSDETEQTRERIFPYLQDQQELFKGSGLAVPELDNYLSSVSGAPSEEGEQSPPELPDQGGGTAGPTASPVPTPQGGNVLLTPVVSPLPPNSVSTLVPSLPTIGVPAKP